LKIKLFVVVIGFINYLNIFLPKEEVVLLNTTSSFVVLQTDSLSRNYYKSKGYLEKEDYKNALIEAQKIFEGDKNIGNKESILANLLLANIFYATRSNHNAIKYYKKTLSELKNNSFDQFRNGKDTLFNKDLIKAEALLNYGNTYYRLNLIDELNIHKDSALYFYNEVNRISSLNKDILEVKSRAYSNSSVIYLNDSLFEKAEKFAKLAIDIHKNQNKKVNEAGALVNLANIYLTENKYGEAKKTYYNALDLIRNEKSSKALMVREKIYFNLAYNLYKLKDYQAYFYQELSYNIKDSLREKEVRGFIEELDAKYNFNVKKDLLLKEEENKRLKDQRIFWVIAVISIIIILSLLYWINYFKLKQKNLGLELSKSQLIQSQHIEKIRSESQARILNATIDGKETERKQIAETLHDSVSALLSSANLHLQATRSHFNGGTPIEIEKTQKIITEASQTIRDLSHTLVSSVLLKFGIEYAIKDMADKYSNSKIKIETNIGYTRRYHQNFEIKVYNIIQEFINNILKHSKAQNAMIEMNEIDGKLSFKITDDGIGFDKTLITNKDGLGLNQIEARIQMMEGYFFVDSNKGNGTVIKVELPILEKEEINLV